ncbi:hypothetical protein [Sphingomonas psychrotolerans]|uniref:Uncharacterized protein n=1 Tax=Sphingomonas psychrotolerans TaxID=1327635 RepID=A0A2K8MJ17_9SPHN|nr:hypothetical protein [Sphingomonas psychrotolerans]ATY33867.1 hypothetical protein CVN68_19480 [Sphingomonas psychrotolerans]
MSYTKYADLSGDRTFASSCTSIINNQTPPGVNPASLPALGLNLAYAAATQSWTVGGDGVNLVFGPGDVDPAAPAGAQFYAKAGASGTDRLRIQVPGIVGVGPLEYARVASVLTNVIGQTRTYTCIIGVPTLVTDVPAATSVTYRAAYGGSVYRTSAAGGATANYSLGKTVVTLGADRITGKVTMSLHLIGTPSGGGADIDFGTVTGTADIDPATGGYYGQDWTSPTLTVRFGQFSGRFYGPQGLETEVAVSLIIEASASAPPFTLHASGTVVGIR